MMEEFTKWCDTESNEKEDAITSAQRTMNDLSASIEDASGSISSLNAETDALAAKISAADADLASATKIRDEERAAFEATEAELEETIDTLGRAIVVLKRGQIGFMQTKGGNKQLETLADTLSKIVAASWVTSDEKVKVQSLLQSEDQDGDLRTKAADSLASAQKAEMESSHSFAMLKQSIE